MSAKLKSILLLLITTVLVMSSFNSYAVEADNDSFSELLTLTLNDAVSKGLEYTNRIRVTDRALEDMWEVHVTLTDSSKEIQDHLNRIEDYSRLYDKLHNKHQQLTLEEIQQYSMFMYMFGPTPPSISREEMFFSYIKNRDFPHYSYWAEVKKATANRDVLIETISLSIRQLYDGALNLQDAQEMQKELLKSMVKQNKMLHLRFEKGLVSKSELDISDINLQQQELNIKKLERSRDNAIMSLKRQTGIPMKQKITLKSYVTGGKIKAPDSYDKYLEKALASRLEVMSVKLDLQVKQRELDIMKQYLTNELLLDRLDAQQSVDEKSLAYNEAVDNVTSDLYEAYKSVLRKQNEIKIAERRKVNAETQLKKAVLQYEQGMIGSDVVSNVETSLCQTKIAYNQTIRDYFYQLYRLELASGIGPGYNLGVGGY